MNGVVARVAAAIVLALALVCAIERIRSGIDLEDEATYIAIPYRFTLGDRPFVDEINPIQTAGFITRPLVALYTGITGGTDGIVLFLRATYLLACAGTAWIAVAFARRFIGLPLALLACTPIVVHMPGIPNLGYHTLASLGFTGGTFALALGLRRAGGRNWLLLAGVLHALAAVAMQVYVLAAVFAALAAVRWLAPERKLRVLVPYAVAGVITGLVFAPYFVDLGRDTLLYVYHHTRRDGTWLAKAEWVFWKQLSVIPNKTGFLIAITALLVATRLRWAVPALLALVALPFLAYVHRGAIGANCNVTVLTMTAPFLYFALRERGEARPLFLGIWLPSFVASLCLAWASSVHVLAEGYAQIPGLVVAAILAVLIARENAVSHALWPSLAWTCAVIASLLLHLRSPYNDDALARLDTRMTDGPWRGIATTQAKALHVQAVHDGIRAYENDTQRVMFLTHFPAGYLMTRMRPAASSVWALTCPGEPTWEFCADALERDLHRYGSRGILVFDVRRTFHSTGYVVQLPRGPVHRVLDACLDTVLVTPEYTVYGTR
jgi:hypothetical protein